MLRYYKSLLGMLGSAFCLALVWAIPAAAANSPGPGALNYVEGQVSVQGRPVTSQSVGSVQVAPNQVLETGQGHAEMLLTPGVFVRLGDATAVRLISPELTNTRIEVLRGQAMVEVAELFKDNNVWIAMSGSQTRLDKQGLYAFIANTRVVQVFDGKATVQQDDHDKELGKGHQLALDGTWKVAHFDTKAQAAQDSLYAWSNLRSEYEAQASMQSARNIFVAGGPNWYGPGWYWNPYWDFYGFVPGDGIWYSPFGWPFYSPWVVGYYGYGYGFGHGFVRGFPRAYVGHGHVAGAIASQGGFAGSARVGGGFGRGGFSGGGFAGGMHGGIGGGRR